MKTLINTLLLLMFYTICSSQIIDKQSLVLIHPDKDYENILVKGANCDSLASSFIIWVKKEVKLHKHNFHTENVYVIEGSGVMKLGDAEFEIKQGDYIFIPKNTPHRVKVTSEIPLKILSVQSPYFDGKDREMLE